MSADRISFEKKGRNFSFDGQSTFNGRVVVDNGVARVLAPLNTSAKHYKLSASALGTIVSTALINGVTKVQFENVTLNINYIVQMLLFVGKHGWFCDVLSNTIDHAFDPNHPTPGLSFGEARELYQQAHKLELYARGARAANLVDDAVDAESQASQLRQTARRLQTQE